MTVTIVPRPESVIETGETFRLTADTLIRASADSTAIARQLQESLRQASGLEFHFAAEVATDAAAGESAIELSLNPALPASGYRISVDAARVRLTGGDAAGLFHATQSFLQLCPPAVFRRVAASDVLWAVPGVEIADQPRFAWRGMLLDLSRHFFGRQSVITLIDALALHHFNVLHLHLTDDQGWRLQIRRYPRLTDVGSWRARSALEDTAELPPDRAARYDSAPHDGYLSQDDVREIVAYAAVRFITVVPEIDLPGHSQAVIAAYPELGNTDEQLAVWTDWGVSPHVLNLEESTLEYYRNVLDEVLELFPSRYIHLGGDECPTDEWRQSPAAQKRMRELGLPDEGAVQGWLTGYFGAFLASRGRRLVGWDEILEGGLPSDATVMSWRGIDGGIAAAEAGHDVIMTPESHTYFHRQQSNDPSCEPLGAAPSLSLRTVHGYDPMPPGLSAHARAHVLGAQCQMWTEFVQSERQMHQMAFPRVSAFAETVWCRQVGSFDEFEERLVTHRKRLHALGIDGYDPAVADPLTDSAPG